MMKILSLKGHTQMLCVFFITWTLMQVVFLIVFWRSGNNNICQTNDIFGEESAINTIAILRKEVGRLRKVIGKGNYESKHGHYEQLTEDVPMIYLITPTYARPTQKADLVRMLQTLLLVPNIFWIVVEDSDKKTNLVQKLLLESGIPHAHLHASTPEEYKLDSKLPRWKKPRGVLQRNRGLQWLRKNLYSTKFSGVVYFADDDNTYHVDLFEEMRYTKGISVWPVGLSGELLVERPIVRDYKIIAWNSVWKPKRPFPADMASFAINLQLLLNNPNAKFTLNSSVGYQESTIITQLIDVRNLEPKADNCTKVLVWHTRTQPATLAGERYLKKHKLNPSNHNIEV